MLQLNPKHHRSPRLGERLAPYQQSPDASRDRFLVTPEPPLHPGPPPPGRPPKQETLTVPLLDVEPAILEAAPDMWSLPQIAIYSHYACVGMVNGLLSQTLLPYCLYVVHGQPNTCATVSTFVNLPWGFKLAYGMLSDAVPICGLHRKPYMVLGWGMLWGGALLLAVLPTLTLPLASTIFLCMTVSYLLADCAADAVLVALSTREAAEARGSLISTAYLIRHSVNVLANGVVAFCYNGPPSGGSFSWGLTTQQLMWIIVAFVGVLMGASLPFLHEAPPGKQLSFRRRCKQLLRLLQQAPVWRLIVALVSITTLSLVTNQAQINANAQWFHIEPLQLGLSACFQSLMMAVGMWAFKRYLLQASWRLTYAGGILGAQLQKRDVWSLYSTRGGS